MEKQRADEEVRMFPRAGEHIAIPLLSSDKREEFILDVSRGRIKLAKVTYQNRARKARSFCYAWTWTGPLTKTQMARRFRVLTYICIEKDME
jgi:hypothetical protein